MNPGRASAAPGARGAATGPKDPRRAAGPMAPAPPRGGAGARERTLWRAREATRNGNGRPGGAAAVVSPEGAWVQEPSAEMMSPNSSQVSPVKRCSCTASIG